MTPDAKLLKSGLSSIGRSFRGEIYEFNPNAPMGKGYSNDGKPFNIEEACYLKPPFRAVRNPNKRKHVWKAGVQSLKTFGAEKSSTFLIVNEPGDMCIYDCDADAARDHCKSRLLPMLRGTPGIEAMIAEVENRHDISTTEFYLPGMTLRMWPLNESSTQRITLRYVIIHDAFLSKCSGMIEHAIARTTQHPKDKKIIIESQGSEEGDDFDRQFLSTDQGILHVACPLCGEYQPFEFERRRDNGTFSGFQRGPDEKVLLPDGGYNAAAILRETYYECFFCRGAWRDNPHTRAHLDESSKYVPANPDADPENCGFNWPNWINRRIPWGGDSVMMGYLSAKRALKDFGIDEPIKQWYQKRAAKTWSDRLEHPTLVIPTGVDVNAAIPNEHHKGIIIDVQQHKELKDVPGTFWYEVYAADKLGSSFQLERGFVESWEALDVIQNKWKIRNSFVCIDGAKWTPEIIKQVAVRRKQERVVNFYTKQEIDVWQTWRVLMGDGRATSFPHKEQSGKPAHRAWSEATPYPQVILNDKGKGEMVRVPVYRFSVLSITDQLHALLIGGGDKPRFVALRREQCSPETQSKESGDMAYDLQMSAEARMIDKGKPVWKKIRPNNHYHDLAKMRLVRMGMAGLAGHLMMMDIQS